MVCVVVVLVGAWNLAKDEGVMEFWWLCANLRVVCVALAAFLQGWAVLKRFCGWFCRVLG